MMMSNFRTIYAEDISIIIGDLKHLEIENITLGLQKGNIITWKK